MSWLGRGMTRLCKTTQATNHNNYLQRLREYQEVEQISTVPPFGLPKANSSVAGSGMPALFAKPKSRRKLSAVDRMDFLSHLIIGFRLLHNSESQRTTTLTRRATLHKAN